MSSTSGRPNKPRRRDRIKNLWRSDKVQPDKSGTSSHDPVVPPAWSSQGHTVTKSLWDEAYENVKGSTSKADAGIVSLLPESGKDPHPSAESICLQVSELAHRDHPCRSLKAGRVYKNIVDCVAKFIQVGDVVAQIDPIHVGLPWAGIRFILQVSGGRFNPRYWVQMLRSFA